MKKSEQFQLEIGRTEEKIVVLQDKLKELHQRKREALDAEILSMVREINCEPGELQEILRAFRTGNLDCFVKRIPKTD